jgi:sortase A
MLSFTGFTLMRASLYQIYEGRVFDRISQQHQVRQGKSRPATVQSESKPHPLLRLIPPVRGEPLARIEIPSVGLNTLVLEGDDTRTLRLGPGHIPGTALPGEAGNVGIAGHRDTFFRRLRYIEKDDIITVRTAAESYSYRVETLRVVAPSEVTVLGPTVDNTLTLVTCYPFSYVGLAPERFIIRARQLPSSRHYPVRSGNKIKTG